MTLLHNFHPYDHAFYGSIFQCALLLGVNKCDEQINMPHKIIENVREKKILDIRELRNLANLKFT